MLPHSRLGNNSALVGRELHYWNLELQIGHIQDSKNLTTGDTEDHRGTERMIGHRRIMALDVGSKRIGVAVSDPLGITAQGVNTIQRQNKRRDLEALGQVLAKYDVREIVVGLPLRLSGAEGTQSEKMRRFADDLHAHFGLTVHLWDERWTSTEANRLLRETDLSIKKRGQAVDRMAAILILQSWMEAHSGLR